MNLLPVGATAVRRAERRHADRLRLGVHGPLHQRLVAGGACFLRTGTEGYARACGPEGPADAVAALAPGHDLAGWREALAAAGFARVLVREDDAPLGDLAEGEPFADYFFAAPDQGPPPALPPAPLTPIDAATADEAAALIAATDPTLGGSPGLSAARLLAGEPGRERWQLREGGRLRAVGCRLLGAEGYDDTEVIVPPGQRCEGVGSRVLAALIARSRACGRGVISGIRADHGASRRMAYKAGLRAYCALRWGRI